MVAGILTGIFLAANAITAQCQVLEDLNLEHEIDRATSMLAGTRADDLPHQVHYELKLVDVRGQESHATYDIFRENTLAHVEMSALGFHYVRVLVDDGKRTWSKETGTEPLKLLDFQMVLLGPSAALSRLKAEMPRLVRQVIDGSPYLCADDGGGTAICFDPLLHIYAFGQTFNQTAVYDTWLKVGVRYVPGHIRIFQGKRLLLEATGTVLPESKFPPETFTIPAQPEDSTVELHSILKTGRTDDARGLLYGNVQLTVGVDEKGKVRKVDVVDSDDKDLEGAAKHFAKTTVYAPYLVNGQPQSFETTLWYRQYPPAAQDE